MKTNVEFSGSIGSNPVNVDAKIRTEIDWEQRKFELVKSVLQGMWANERWNDTPYFEIAEIAIEQADTVLAEYRKGGGQ